MMTYADIEQVDPVLSEDGRSVAFYGWTSDIDSTFFWSVDLPMRIEEDAFDDVQREWVALGWLHVMREAGQGGMAMPA